MKVLVTGAAGFIASKLMFTLKERGDEVVGIDNFNDYYDVRLKEERLEKLSKYPDFTFVKGDIADKAAVDKAAAEPPKGGDCVCQLGE